MVDRDQLGRSLALARSGLGASAAARARVRARLGAGGAPASSAADAAGAAAAGALGGAAPARTIAGSLLSAAKRLSSRPTLRAATWVGLGLCAGYWLGFHRIGAELIEAPPDASARSTEPSLDSSARLASSRPVDVDTEPSSEAVPSARAAEPALEAEATDLPSRPADAERARAKGPAPARAHKATLPRAATRDTFAAELALLERAERAIRAQEGELALAFLEQLDREFPASSLREERRAARVLARCVQAGTGSPDERAAARASAEQFLSGSSSVYAGRVRQLCELDSGN